MLFANATLDRVYPPSEFATLWVVEFVDLAGTDHRYFVEHRCGRDLLEREGDQVDIVVTGYGTVAGVAPAGLLTDEDAQQIVELVG